MKTKTIHTAASVRGDLNRVLDRLVSLQVEISEQNANAVLGEAEVYIDLGGDGGYYLGQAISGVRELIRRVKEER